MRLGEPIPGYTGVSRRVIADNVFGATYADARKKGDQSLKDIGSEKTHNFTTQSQRAPPIQKWEENILSRSVCYYLLLII